MKRISLIILIGAIAIPGIILIIYSCKKDDDTNKSPSLNTAPVAAFTISPESGSIQTNFLFDASNSSDNEDATSVLLVRWDWDNDGVWDTDWSSDKDVNHTYAQEGNYNVSLEVKDTQGLSDATSKSVLVSNAGGNDPPVAGFIADDTSILVGQTINFTDQSGNGPTSWQWDFGDGGTSTDQNPSHPYITEGTYSVSLTVSNSYGSDSEVKANFITVSGGAGEPCPGIPSFTYQGQTYNTVLIGSQCWMKENLNVGMRINGSQVPVDNGTIEKYCYDDDEANCDVYGGLYQWNEMMQYVSQQGTQGICPDGWHIPTDGDWTALTNSLGGESIAGGKMKETGTAHWDSPNTGASNSSGFTALPGGFCNSFGYFNYLGYYGLFWSSSVSGAANAWKRDLYNTSEQVYRYDGQTTAGYSVRCLKD